MNTKYNLGINKLTMGMVIEFEDKRLGLLINKTVLTNFGGIGLDRINFNKKEDSTNKKYTAIAVYRIREDADLKADMSFWMMNKQFIRKETSEKIWERS